jgi:hypothetical protein
VTDPFRLFLYSYFGLGAPAPLVEDGPGVAVSLNKGTYKPGEAMSILLIPDEEAALVSGSLMLTRGNTETVKAVPLGARQEIQFR